VAVFSAPLKDYGNDVIQHEDYCDGLRSSGDQNRREEVRVEGAGFGLSKPPKEKPSISRSPQQGQNLFFLP
jgi:hypothetical protein